MPTSLALKPTVPSVTVWPVREPPTPTKRCPLVTVMTVAFAGPESVPPETSDTVSVKAPER